MTFKMNILASDEAQYLDANNVKTERTCLSKDGKHVVLWKIGTKYYVEINTYYDENFWQGEDNAFDRSEYIIEVKKLTDEEVEEYFEAYNEQYGRNVSAKALGWTVRENRSPLFITFAVSGANLYSAKRLPSATSFNGDFRYGQLYETILKSHNNDITKTA